MIPWLESCRLELFDPILEEELLFFKLLLLLLFKLVLLKFDLVAWLAELFEKLPKILFNNK
jgi:hypothetical protein